MAARSFLYGAGAGAGAGGGGGSVLLTNKRVHCSSSSASAKNLDSFFISGSSSPTFLGSQSMFSFEDGGRRSRRPFFQSYDQEDNGDDDYDEYFHQPDKKRRLTVDQVQFLEKSFDTDNKLEPERKIQLAKELGLQPRQVAIWFQNRRARWKNKQLEKDYDVLQENYNKLKVNYENLLKEKEKLKSEVEDLSHKLLKGTSDSSSTKSQSEALQHEHVADYAYDENVSRNLDLGYVRDDNVGAKSVVFDSDTLLERDDSSYVFEQEQSDGSVDEEDNFSKIFLQPPVGGYMSPKIENDEYTDLNSVNSYYLGLSGDDQGFGFWSF